MRVSYSESYLGVGFVVDRFTGFEGQGVGELEGDAANKIIYMIDAENMT